MTPHACLLGILLCVFKHEACVCTPDTSSLGLKNGGAPRWLCCSVQASHACAHGHTQSQFGCSVLLVCVGDHRESGVFSKVYRGVRVNSKLGVCDPCDLLHPGLGRCF